MTVIDLLIMCTCESMQGRPQASQNLYGGDGKQIMHNKEFYLLK